MRRYAAAAFSLGFSLADGLRSLCFLFGTQNYPLNKLAPANASFFRPLNNYLVGIGEKLKGEFSLPEFFTSRTGTALSNLFGALFPFNQDREL